MSKAIFSNGLSYKNLSRRQRRAILDRELASLRTNEVLNYIHANFNTNRCQRYLSTYNAMADGKIELNPSELAELLGEIDTERKFRIR